MRRKQRNNSSHFKTNSLVVLTKNYDGYTAGHIFAVYDPQKYGSDYKIKVREPDDFSDQHIVAIPKKYLADVK